MRIVLEVPENVAESAARIAEVSGISREAILTEALRAHFPPLDEDLRAEFEQWETASEIDSANLGL